MPKHFNPMAGTCGDIECNECTVSMPESDTIACAGCGFPVCEECRVDDKCHTCNTD